jgi:hypothetical protein
MVGQNSYFDFFFRKKSMDEDNIGETKLARVLNTFDLTALGIGSTLGTLLVRFFNSIFILKLTLLNL